MTSIRAHCPDCGDVHLVPDDLVVRVCADDRSGAYAFACPDCGRRVAKAASTRIVDLLLSSGVDVEIWNRPEELEEARVGPPISLDDVLDFHLGLERGDWFAELGDIAGRTAPE